MDLWITTVLAANTNLYDGCSHMEHLRRNEYRAVPTTVVAFATNTVANPVDNTELLIIQYY